MRRGQTDGQNIETEPQEVWCSERKERDRAGELNYPTVLFWARQAGQPTSEHCRPMVIHCWVDGV